MRWLRRLLQRLTGGSTRTFSAAVTRQEVEADFRRDLDYL